MTEFWIFDALRWPAGNGGLACAAAFLWGLGSALLSPCHLGVIPLMGSHAAGLSPFGGSGTGGRGADTGRMVTQVCVFALGYFAVIPLLALGLLWLGAGLEHVSHYWTIPVGAVFMWLGFSMLRSHSCSRATGMLASLAVRWGLKPLSAALVLGFAYGTLSSGCTAGFLMPLLLAALPQGMLFGVSMALCFGLGHSLPMVLVGCSAHAAARLYHSHAKDPCADHDHAEPHRAERLFRRVMGVIIMLAGVLFVLHPFLEH